MDLSSNQGITFEMLIDLIIQPLNMLAELGGMDMEARSFIESLLKREPSAMQVIENLTFDQKSHGVIESMVGKQDQMIGAISEELSLKTVDNLIEQTKTTELSRKDRAELFYSKCSSRNIKLSPAQPQAAWALQIQPTSNTKLSTAQSKETWTPRAPSISKPNPISEKPFLGSNITDSQDDVSNPFSTIPDQVATVSEDVITNITSTTNDSPPDQTATPSQDVAIQIEVQPQTEAIINKLTVNERIASMMAKMGYKEGQGLGKKQQGIREPVRQTIQVFKNGLGFVEKPTGCTATITDQKLMEEVDRMNAAIDPALMYEWQNLPDRRSRKKVKESKIHAAEKQSVLTAKQSNLPEKQVAEKATELPSVEQASGSFKTFNQNSVIGRVITYGKACGYCYVRSQDPANSTKSMNMKLPLLTIFQALSKQEVVHSPGTEWIQVEISDHLQILKDGGHGTVICKNITRNAEGKVYIDYMEKYVKPEMNSPKSIAKANPKNFSEVSNIEESPVLPSFKDSPGVVAAPFQVAPPTEVGASAEAIASVKILPRIEIRDREEKKLNNGSTRFTENYVCANASELPPVLEHYESKVFWGKIKVPLELGQTEVSQWESFARDHGARDKDFRKDNDQIAKEAHQDIVAQTSPVSSNLVESTANKAKMAISPTQLMEDSSRSVQPAIVSLPHSRSASTGSNTTSNIPIGDHVTPEKAKESYHSHSHSSSNEFKNQANPTGLPVRPAALSPHLVPHLQSGRIHSTTTLNEGWNKPIHTISAAVPHERPSTTSVNARYIPSGSSESHTSDKKPISTTLLNGGHTMYQQSSQCLANARSASPESNTSKVSATEAAVMKSTSVKITNYQPRPKVLAWFRQSFASFGEIKYLEVSGSPSKKNHQVVITFANPQCAAAAVTAANAGAIGGRKMSAVLV